jgi:pimeloyl-ACP methyl ester carboxylesterase
MLRKKVEMLTQLDVKPFKVEISEEVLVDLQDRLSHTRWPDEITGSGWSYGTNMTYLKELVEYWRTTFDWRAQEKVINTFRHYKADIDGLGVHFIHEPGKGPNPMPLIISHGWPSTFCEIIKLIPFLTDPAGHGGNPEDSFDVVVPSLPGFGFSDRSTTPGMNSQKIADIFARIMEGLGYHTFGAHGGDWGGWITSRMGLSYPERVLGVHVTLLNPPPYLGPGARPLSEAERVMMEEREKMRTSGEGSGYFHLQETKPQTAAYGLNDSPTGVAAWILEKIQTWSDCNGDVESRFTKDELLTNITIYWATETINSSMRLYYEQKHYPWTYGLNERVEVPCGICFFSPGRKVSPREFVERNYNVKHWTVMPRGGHFAAHEEPELLAEDLRTFFRGLRK